MERNNAESNTKTSEESTTVKPLLKREVSVRRKSSIVVFIPSGTISKVDEVIPEHVTKALLLPQILIALLVDVIPLILGINTGFVGIYLPDIRNDSAIQATMEEGSWIASIYGLGSIPGCLIAAWTTTQFGRLRTMKVSCVPMIIGWAMIGFASSVGVMYVGRFLIGVGNGINSGSKQVYLAEICDVRLRGTLTASAVVAATSGIFLSYVFALFMHWRTLSKICMGVSIAALVSYFFLPESPTFLVTAGRNTDAKNALQKVRGQLYDVNEELNAIVDKHEQNQKESLAAKGHWKESAAIYFSPQTLKAFGILFLVFFVQRFSGTPVITSYIMDIFDTSTGGAIDGHYAALITGLLRMLLTMFGSFLLKAVRKKIIYSVSGLGMTLSLFTIATYNYLSEINGGNIGYTWVPAVGVIGLVSFVTPGFITVSWVLIGELFPQRTRGTMSSLFTCVGFTLYFSVVKLYPEFVDVFHVYGTFYIYGVIAFVGTIFVIFVLPETKDKTLAEIEDELVKVEHKVEKQNMPIL